MTISALIASCLGTPCLAIDQDKAQHEAILTIARVLKEIPDSQVKLQYAGMQTILAQSSSDSSSEAQTFDPQTILTPLAIALAGILGVQLRRVKVQKEHELVLLQNRLQEEAEAVRDDTLNSLYKSEPLSNDDKRNAIVIVGLGGSGKTTLINKLFSNNANPKIATKDYKIYQRIDEEESGKYHYYVSDYMGQNLGSLISSLMEEQKTPYSPMTLGAINSLIFLVDVAEAQNPGITSNSNNFSVSWQERSKVHLKEWSPTALDAIFGIVTDISLQYVCLFINKVDLIPDVSEEEIITQYQRLIHEIVIRCRGVKFEYFLGSADTGTNLLALKQSIKESSMSKIMTSVSHEN